MKPPTEPIGPTAASGPRGDVPVAKGPPISAFMTSHPHTIGVTQSLSVAHRMMQEHRVRHLPVLRGGRLVGLLSQRDLLLVETLDDVDPNTVPVEEAMTQEPFTVGPEAPVRAVAEVMAGRKYGSVLVVDDHAHIIGIFTATDAMRALVSLLKPRASHA